MSLKIIADACRIVDRGQDTSLRDTNHPYSFEEDELVKKSKERPAKAESVRVQRRVEEDNKLFNSFYRLYARFFKSILSIRSQLRKAGCRFTYSVDGKVFNPANEDEGYYWPASICCDRLKGQTPTLTITVKFPYALGTRALRKIGFDTTSDQPKVDSASITTDVTEDSSEMSTALTKLLNYIYHY